MEDNSHLMWVVMIFVHHHQRPVPIWAKHWVCRDQHVTLSILDVADSREQLVVSVLRLHPFLRN